jgi:hypothetical protein
MMAGQGGIVSGRQNKLEAAAAHVIPAEMLAKAVQGNHRSNAGKSRCIFKMALRSRRYLQRQALGHIFYGCHSRYAQKAPSR